MQPSKETTPADDTFVSSEDMNAQREPGVCDHDESANIVTICKSKGQSSESAWVQKTFGMVNEGSRFQPNVLSWSDDGKEFEIRDADTFKKTLFPKYHGSTQFQSFERRLRRYGFQRVKKEPIAKSRGGFRTSVVVSFRHENFQRDRADLLSSVAIVSTQGEASKSTDEKQSLSETLEELERNQAEMRAMMSQFKHKTVQQKNQIDLLRHDAVSKDQTIRRLEFRLERLEKAYHSLLTTERPPAEPKAYVPSFQPVREPSNALERDISVMSAVDFLPLLNEGSPPDDEPTLPRSQKMKLYRPTTGVSLALTKRDISMMSAVDFLPLLNEGNPPHDEPTLPRSKKMKCYHQGMSLSDIFEGRLSRQMTPMF